MSTTQYIDEDRNKETKVEIFILVYSSASIFITELSLRKSKVCGERGKKIYICPNFALPVYILTEGVYERDKKRCVDK